MRKEIIIERKTFTNDKGQDIPYTSYILEIGGKSFQLLPRTEDKKLINYLVEMEENEQEALWSDYFVR